MTRVRLSTVQGSLISFLIRWLSDSHHSHIELERQDGWTLGARFSLRGKIARWLGRPRRWRNLDGVQWRPPDPTQSNVLYITFPGIEGAIPWVEQNRLGAPYDLIGILGIVTAKGWADSRDAFCSELAQEFAQAVGLSQGKGFQDCSPQATKPRDIEISLAITKL